MPFILPLALPRGLAGGLASYLAYERSVPMCGLEPVPCSSELLVKGLFCGVGWARWVSPELRASCVRPCRRRSGLLGFTSALRPFASQPERRLGQAGATRSGADSGSMPSPETAPWPRTSLVGEHASDGMQDHDSGCSRFSRMSITDMDVLLPCGASASDRLPGKITAHSAAQMLW
jgi:hypothetical protein